MANAVVETHEHGTAASPTTPVERTLTGPARLMQFFHDTRQEMRKVVTPTGAEVKSNTIIVIVTVFAFAAYFEVVDLIFGKGIDKLFLHLTKH